MATESKPKIVLRASMLTDVGVVRDHNEDAAYIDPQERFFIVADGMGGHAAGEIASAMTVDTVRAALERADPQIREFAREPTDAGRKALAGILEQAVRDAHSAVYNRGVREPDKQGMGTTVDAVLLAGPEAFIAHVGDSRTFLLREGKLAQITTDHTVAEVLLLEGKLSPEEAQVSPLRTILVNAIGVAEDVGVEMAHLNLQPGDQLLLSSDGLHDYFPAEDEIAERLAGKPDEILAGMIETAKERGGHDNITGVVLQIADLVEAREEADAPEGEAVPEPLSRVDTLPFGQVALSPSELGEDEEDSEEAPFSPAGAEERADDATAGDDPDRESRSPDEGSAASDENAPPAREVASVDSGDEAEKAPDEAGRAEGEKGHVAAEGDVRDEGEGGAAAEDRDGAPGDGGDDGDGGDERGEARDGAAANGARSREAGERESDERPSASEDDVGGDAEGDRESALSRAESKTAENEGGSEGGANGSSEAQRAPSPPLVPETKGEAVVPADDEDDYVEDDTLVGYDPESVKPPAPKSGEDRGSDGDDDDRPDPEA